MAVDWSLVRVGLAILGMGIFTVVIETVVMVLFKFDRFGRTMVYSTMANIGSLLLGILMFLILASTGRSDRLPAGRKSLTGEVRRATKGVTDADVAVPDPSPGLPSSDKSRQARRCPADAETTPALSTRNSYQRTPPHRCGVTE